jgi:hypothetical protein
MFCSTAAPTGLIRKDLNRPDLDISVQFRRLAIPLFYSRNIFVIKNTPSNTTDNLPDWVSIMT